ncbi:Ubiquinone biosynthesis protein coq9, mitochondrial [Daldinia childiae]|uniref:Ubiquinone biosynthesis protein coq9, mitochondrial n=1 Tax=Daldinia childiae TaxID=326645 RepID=UPI001445AF31|nr:Ubiquinone biosynthesis protein coq9, mitochondrial [Daldinia childiae]KAF3061604.1 Ubiquinone biosynthesis protein coq9, mitochondrial [Daldinia childiae]
MAPSRAPLTRLATTLLRQTTCTRTTTTSSILPRHYHSYDHPPPPTSFSTAERAILSSAYNHVPEHGFTQHALALGARDAGYPDISTNVVPEGPYSLIRYHLVTKREALAPWAKAIFGSEGGQGELLKVPEKVERLAWERLVSNSEVNHRWQEALALMAQPSHIPSSLHELALLADEIYFLSGDTSVDPSWYTKRGTLSVIYASSELFMTNDRSPGYGETRAFLQRRLDETSTVGGALGSVAQWVGFTASAGVNVLRSKGVRI